MRATKPTRRGLISLAFVLGILFPGAAGVLADDTELFTNTVPPNVMLIVDNSASMNHVVWHPRFVPEVVFDPLNCPYYADPADPNYKAKCLKYPLCNIAWGDNDLGSNWWGSEGLRITTSRTVDKGDDWWEDSVNCNEREIFATGGTSFTLWDLTYLRWYFSNNVEEDPDGDGLTILADIEKTDNGQRPECLIDAGVYSVGATYAKYRRTRAEAAQDIFREVICNTSRVAEIRYGMAVFNPTNYWYTADPDGGYVKVPIADYSEAQAGALETAIGALDGETLTPLAETLYMIYQYFQSRNASKTAFGKDGTTRFPVYPFDTTGHDWGTIPGHPVTDDCQKHFVVLLTDGLPKDDDFTDMDEFDTLIGDYNQPSPDEVEEPGGGVGMYLDDVAKFMHEHDFMLEDAFPGMQTIDVYTVGFTTGDTANDLLSRAATVGGGKSFASNNAEELTEAIARTISDIVTKAKAFTAATVPASRATDGNNFFTSYFMPSGESPFWQGHLKLFEFNALGEIRDEPAVAGQEGECALDDPLAPTRCQQGPLKLALEGYWDAANEIPAADSRNLYVSKLPLPSGTPPVLPDEFTAAEISAADLGVDGAGPADIGAYDLPLPDYDISGITTDEQLADAIVNYVRGCEFSDPSGGCVDRGDGQKLWDIFHSNPIVVGPPNSSLRDPKYREFVGVYKHRERVIYAGSNGGFVHGFNTGEYDTAEVPLAYDRGTGEEEFGFMAYPARQNIAELPKDTPPRDFYYMDGSPSAADVWLPPGDTAKPANGSWSDWRTVLVGGMRQGGRVVWALDVTNPSGEGGAGIPYPGYLWEFPCEASSCDEWRPYMGETWSQPVITRVKATVGYCANADGSGCATYDRWVAIFGGGYDASGDPNMPHDSDGTVVAGEYDPSWDDDTMVAGRAIFVVDIATGEVLAAKHFQVDGTAWNASGGDADGEPGMRYAIAAQPAVFDFDFDGYADAIYVGDLGGNVWKWMIHPPAEDFIRNPAYGNYHQARWKFRKIMAAQRCSVVDCPTNGHFKSFFYPPTGAQVGQYLWLALGSGERNDLDYARDGVPDDNAKNRYYVFKDIDPFEVEREATDLPYSDAADADFVNGTTITTFNPNTCLPTGNVGFYLEGDAGEKFVTDSVIFFGLVLTGSYVPAPSTADPCTASGQSYLYAFHLLCGEGAFPPATEGDPRPRRIEIGNGSGGLPNAPRVSVGPVGGGGGGGGDCTDMVVVITSEGAGFEECLTDRPDSGLHVKSWRDL